MPNMVKWVKMGVVSFLSVGYNKTKVSRNRLYNKYRKKGNDMDKKMLKDIVAQLDGAVEQGTGHINVFVESGELQQTKKEVETMGCADCSKNPMACAVPTMELEGDYDD